MEQFIAIVTEYWLPIVGFIGVVAAGYLKFIAPKTKTKVDDAIAKGIADAADKVDGE